MSPAAWRSFTPHPTIPLTHRDPYTLLVAVILSAQCTDVRVNQVTPALFALADTPAKMAALSVAQIDAIVRPCGLSPMKAKNIREMSRLLLERHGGQVPRTFAELEALPGVGHKTASVLMVQAFNHPAFPVDTHIHRLAMRWKLSRGPSVVHVERDLKKLFPPESWHDPAPAHYLLWPGALHRARLRRTHVRNLPEAQWVGTPRSRCLQRFHCANKTGPIVF